MADADAQVRLRQPAFTALGPFDEQHGILFQQFAQPQVLEFPRIGHPVEVEMIDPALPDTVWLDQGVGRTLHRTLMPQATQESASQGGLAHTQFATQEDHQPGQRRCEDLVHTAYRYEVEPGPDLWGQALDLEAEGREIDIAMLENIHIHKTGALIRASVRTATLALVFALLANATANVLIRWGMRDQPLSLTQPVAVLKGIVLNGRVLAGIVLFAVRPGLTQQSVGVTLAYGAAFGALAYATFTVTNYAVLNQWTFTLVWTDIAWGTVLTAVVAACGFYAAPLVD